MVGTPFQNSRLKPKIAADSWLARTVAQKNINSFHQEIFNTFSDSLASADPDVDQSQRPRTTPITKFSLTAFAKRLTLLQRARVRDIRKLYPNYSEPIFSQEIKVLLNRRVLPAL